MSENKGYKVVSKQPRYQGRFTPKGNEAMRTLGIRLSLSTIQWLEMKAKKEGLSKSDIARKLIEYSIKVEKR